LTIWRPLESCESGKGRQAAIRDKINISTLGSDEFPADPGRDSAERETGDVRVSFLSGRQRRSGPLDQTEEIAIKAVETLIAKELKKRDGRI
jgi:hypothetical protein